MLEVLHSMARTPVPRIAAASSNATSRLTIGSETVLPASRIGVVGLTASRYGTGIAVAVALTRSLMSWLS